MTDLEKLDSLIAIVLNNFKENEITKIIIRKLCDMYESKNLSTIGNCAESTSKRMHRKIDINLDNKTIKYEDIGSKDNRKYVNISSYQEIEDKAVAHQIRVELMSKREKKYVTDTTNKTECYKYYENNDIIGYYEIKTTNKAIAVREDEVERQSLSSQKLLYKLLNGDVLKVMIDADNKKTYFYCDISELKQDRTKNNQIRIDKEITKEEADQILASNNDVLNVISNNTIYAIRGSAYCRKI